MRQTKKYLITGHPRSGTGYASALFRANGIDIGHETMGSDGTSSWMMAVESDEYPWTRDRRQDYGFDTVIHVFRNPMDVINSVAFTEKQESQKFKKRFIPMRGNEFERAVMSYFGWTKLIQSQRPDHTVRLEGLKELMNFEKDVGITNGREHANITEHELRERVSPEAWEMFEWLTEFYNKL